MARHNLTVPALLDEDSRVIRRYGVRSTPSRFLIDRQGRMVAWSIGLRYWTSEEAQRLIATLSEAST